MMFFDMVVENWVIVLNCGRCDSEDIEKGIPWEILGNHVQSDSVSNRLFVQNMQVLTGPQNGCYGNGFKMLLTVSRCIKLNRVIVLLAAGYMIARSTVLLFGTPRFSEISRRLSH